MQTRSVSARSDSGNWAFVTMLVVFLVLKSAGILRVSAEEEQAGLDVSEHGMHAYTGDAPG